MVQTSAQGSEWQSARRPLIEPSEATLNFDCAAPKERGETEAERSISPGCKLNAPETGGQRATPQIGAEAPKLHTARGVVF